jgi:hypothetical protein
MKLGGIYSILVSVFFWSARSDPVNPSLRGKSEEIVELHKRLFRELGPLQFSGECAPCRGPFSNCASTGVVCPLVYAPVCGCDGVTYGNKCIATELHCVGCVTYGRCKLHGRSSCACSHVSNKVLIAFLLGGTDEVFPPKPKPPPKIPPLSQFFPPEADADTEAWAALPDAIGRDHKHKPPPKIPPLSQFFPPLEDTALDTAWTALDDILPPLSLPPVPVPPKEPPHPPREKRRHLIEAAEAWPPLSQIFPPNPPDSEHFPPLSQIFPPDPPVPLNEFAHFPGAEFIPPLSQLFPPNPPHLPEPDCPCPFPSAQPDCCVLPANVCTPGEKQCTLPPWVPMPPVCGCNGVTYENACVAAVENCVRCFRPGFCPATQPPVVQAATG